MNIKPLKPFRKTVSVKPYTRRDKTKVGNTVPQRVKPYTKHVK